MNRISVNLTAFPIELRNLSIGYGTGYRAKVLNKDINLMTHSGELIALIGANGTGKTTLLRTLARLQTPLLGEVVVNGKPAKQYSRLAFARMVSFISTGVVPVDNLTVAELIALGRYPYSGWFGALRADDRLVVKTALQNAGIEHLADRNITEVSDGERQRAMIARTIAQDTMVVVLDEPTAFLDIPSKYAIIKLLHDLCHNKGKTIIFSTHDFNQALRFADKIWLMKPNEIVEGAPEDLALNNTFESLFDSEMLQFNRLTGEFDMVRNRGQQVSIDTKKCNDATLITWTHKALERAGFLITYDETTGIEILPKSIGTQNEWMLRYGQTTETHHSLYTLLKSLNTLA